MHRRSWSGDGRIEEILPVAEIIRRTIVEFGAVLGSLAGRYLVTG
jgi:hypothetical protein